MQRGSSVLERLAALAGFPGIPHLSVFGTADTAVASTTVFPAGERCVVPGAGHNALLFDEDVAGRIIRRVRPPRA